MTSTGHGTERWPWWGHALTGAIVLGYAYWLWAPMLDYFFLLEDGHYLNFAKTLQQETGSILDVRSALGGHRFRPLIYIAYGVEWGAFGLDPRPYHAVALLLGLGCGGLMWAWCWDRRCGATVAWLAAAFFLWHPLQWPRAAIGSYGPSFLACWGILGTLWAGQCVLDGGRRWQARSAVAAFVAGILVMEYAFTGAVALMAVVIVHRRWAAARRLWPFGIAVGVYVIFRVGYYVVARVQPTLGDAPGFAFYQQFAAATGTYLPSMLVQFLLAVPVINAAFIGVPLPFTGWTGTYGVLALAGLLALGWVRWRRRTDPTVLTFDLALFQVGACLPLLAIAPGIHLARALYPSVGLCVALAWAVRPLVRRPAALAALLATYAILTLLTVGWLREGRGNRLPLEQMQARNALNVGRYRAVFAQNPLLDAVYVHGHERLSTTWFMEGMLIGATPPGIQWIDDPVTALPFANAAVFAMKAPADFGPIGVARSHVELQDFAARPTNDFGARGW